MAALKPWETTVPMASQPISSSLNMLNNGIAASIEQPRIMQGTTGSFLSPPPPPPPRIVQQQQQQPPPYGPYSSMNYLSPYSLNPYQTGGFYNNYRLSPYGQSSMPVSNFSQLALDESRSAFSSIESVIHAFRSISFMFESTFTSIYSSFRAVTDVIDQFARLRIELTAIYPLVLLWKFCKYIYYRLLRLLHLRRTTSDETWSMIYQNLQQTRNNSNSFSTSTSTSSSSSSTNLLVALFFLVSIGTPMLMLKFLNSIIKKRQTTSNWLEQDTNQACVIALYDYVARNSDELSFRKGTTIYLAPIELQSTNSHWFLGSIDRIHTGLIPANYVQPIRQQTNSSVKLQPQIPINATTFETPSVTPSTSSTITNRPSTDVNNEEQPTLS